VGGGISETKVNLSQMGIGAKKKLFGPAEIFRKIIIFFIN
jgi:hypothetical protein